MLINVFIFLIKVARKLRIGKFAFRILNSCFHEQVSLDKDALERAQNLLNKLSPDPNNSCILPNANQIQQAYDLQVIIPAYNAEAYIERCVDSVLCQQTSYKVLVTVINDGSTDNTTSILKKYESDDRVEVITQENRGFSGARNRGLNNLKAKYISFLDSDDEWMGDVNQLLQTAYETDADIIEGSYVVFNETGDLQTVSHDDLVAEKGGSLLYGFPWGKLIKSELFQRICFPELYWFEDTVMAFIIYPLCQKVVTSSILFYRYRMNPLGISATSVQKPKVVDSYWITERLLKDRAIIGLENGEFIETMLGQVRMNYNRIRSLKRTDVDRAVFILTAHLWNNYFATYQCDAPLAKALNERDYLMYKLILELC